MSTLWNSQRSRSPSLSSWGVRPARCLAFPVRAGWKEGCCCMTPCSRFICQVAFISLATSAADLRGSWYTGQHKGPPCSPQSISLRDMRMIQSRASAVHSPHQYAAVLRGFFSTKLGCNGENEGIAARSWYPNGQAVSMKFIKIIYCQVYHLQESRLHQNLLNKQYLSVFRQTSALRRKVLKVGGTHTLGASGLRKRRWVPLDIVGEAGRLFTLLSSATLLFLDCKPGVGRQKTPSFAH